jgi:hypothetical protein
MLEIVRGRNWSVVHTVYDDAENGTPTDLSQFTSIISQIREKTAMRNRRGFFEHAKVADVIVSTEANQMTLSLTAEVIATLNTGDYLIDAVGTLDGGSHESLLDPEPVSVVNRPSQPS